MSQNRDALNLIYYDNFHNSHHEMSQWNDSWPEMSEIFVSMTFTFLFVSPFPEQVLVFTVCGRPTNLLKTLWEKE